MDNENRDQQAQKAKTEKKDLSGKGKKAYYRLEAIERGIGYINSLLTKVKNTLERIITVKDTTTEDSYPKNNKTSTKSDVSKRSNRIEFLFKNLRFYIDSTIETSEGNNEIDIKGSIIYGTSRSLCFTDPVEPKKCKKCERTARCDHLEDKPLLKLSLSHNGRIQSIDNFDGEWWVDKEDDLTNLHYIVLDHIWKKALEWTNENIMP